MFCASAASCQTDLKHFPFNHLALLSEFGTLRVLEEDRSQAQKEK